MIEAQAVVEEALAAAAAGGADGCSVLVGETSHADVRFAVNRTTTNGVRRDRSVTVITVVGGAVGTARRSGVVDVEAMVAAALADARSAPAAEDAFVLVDGMTAARSGAAVAAASAAFGSPPPETDLSALGGVLSGLRGAFGRAESRGVTLAGFGEYGLSTLYLGSSTGVRLSFTQPEGALQVVGRTADGAVAAPVVATAWAGQGGADFAVLSFEEMETEIWRRLEWAGRAEAIALDAGRYEVILPPSAVADMMGSLIFYGLGGQDAEDGRTVFSGAGGGTRVGESLSPVPFTLYSDPIEPGIECLPFVAHGSSSSDGSVFDNGLPLGRTEWISEGRLAHLRYHRAGAARSGVEATPYVDNLVLRADGDGAGAGPGATVDDMVARTERGLLLTCLWYIREVDPATLLLTGLTRDGVYLVEHGEVTGAVNNFRFNESPVDLLARATEVGTPARTLGRELGEYLNRTVMPPLRIPDFNMSSVSQAS
ncbi:MAG TPA: metallopeptidase TldD-related protein [Acidimicrobiales bacterium]|nr:metallopeptidase TldD-related protein [Acidimicrobiales bacterium]